MPFSLAIEMWGEGDRNGVQCFDLFNPSGKDLRVSSFVLEGSCNSCSCNSFVVVVV